MPIYSRNSVGSAIHIAANENYSYQDFGRVLVESVQNDMIVFNAALRNDFKENAAIREGTMLASELTSFREFSVKEAWANLKEKLKKLWEKIKGIFRQVFAKLTVWLVKNGNAFVAMHRKTLASKPNLGKTKVPKYLKAKDNAFSSNLAQPIIDEYKNNFKATAVASVKEYDANVNLNKYLSKALPGVSDVTADNFAEKAKEYYFEEMKDTTFASIGVSLESLFNNITSRSKRIKDLKKAEKDFDAAVKKAIKKLDDEAKNAEKASDDTSKENENSGNTPTMYKNASKCVSNFERAVTIATKANINAIKTSVKQDRMLVGLLAAASPTQEAYFIMAEGADDFDSQEDYSPEEINDPEVQADPDVVINVNVDDDECDD